MIFPNYRFFVKIMFLMLGIVIVSIMTVTLAYAALSVTLNITGNARVSAADWDIYLGNQVISDGSVSDSTLSVNGTKATFDATFNMPGDYYEFTIDVISPSISPSFVTSKYNVTESLGFVKLTE